MGIPSLVTINDDYLIVPPRGRAIQVYPNYWVACPMGGI
jgi:hypothetical protein